MDWQHGFSLQPVNINMQIVPGYEMVLTVTPDTSGDQTIICNEYLRHRPSHHDRKNPRQRRADHEQQEFRTARNPGCSSTSRPKR